MFDNGDDVGLEKSGSNIFTNLLIISVFWIDWDYAGQTDWSNFTYFGLFTQKTILFKMTISLCRDPGQRRPRGEVSPSVLAGRGVALLSPGGKTGPGLPGVQPLRRQ